MQSGISKQRNRFSAAMAHATLSMHVCMALLMLASTATAYQCSTCNTCNYNGCSDCFYTNGYYCESRGGSCSSCSYCGVDGCTGCSYSLCTYTNWVGIGCAIAFTIVGVICIIICAWFCIKRSREQKLHDTQMATMQPAAGSTAYGSTGEYAFVPSSAYGQQPYGAPATGYPMYGPGATADHSPMGYPAPASVGPPPPGYPTPFPGGGMPPLPQPYPSMSTPAPSKI
mmetsp:Transcript_43412/g.130212  ORF Transcript_43412/g.130212 Transcript_43412/m.130212 type:complete len:227 (+) Transcript_43412:155-835(+)